MQQSQLQLSFVANSIAAGCKLAAVCAAAADELVRKEQHCRTKWLHSLTGHFCHTLHCSTTESLTAATPQLVPHCCESSHELALRKITGACLAAESAKQTAVSHLHKVQMQLNPCWLRLGPHRQRVQVQLNPSWLLAPVAASDEGAEVARLLRYSRLQMLGVQLLPRLLLNPEH